jgi:hypothetical protein
VDSLPVLEDYGGEKIELTGNYSSTLRGAVARQPFVTLTGRIS